MDNYIKTREFLKVLFPGDLAQDEYITLWIKGNFKKKESQHDKAIQLLFGDMETQDQKDITMQLHCKSIDEAIETINKYIYSFNIFVSLPTTDGKGRKKENLINRNVIAFDFDKKDYNDIKELSFYIDKFKEHCPGLYYHMVVDSGNGYHFYIITEKTTDHKRITKINETISKKLGADDKARLETQVLRVPGTRNLKEPTNPKYVNLVVNNTNTDKFRPYTLEELENRFCKEFKVNTEINKDNKPINYKSLGKAINVNYDGMTCIINMIKEKCIPTGHRNFCLGRIVNFLKVKGYTEGKALQYIKNWNLYSCIEPKSDKILSDEFKAYWKGNYKLLGCNLADKRLQQILHTYCNKSECNYITDGNNIIDDNVLLIDNKYLGVDLMRNFKGGHYLILTILLTDIAKDTGVTIDRINKRITSSISKKPCLSRPTVLNILKDLNTRGIIEVIEPQLKNEPYLYRIKDTRHFGQGYTRLLYSSSLLLINKIITQQEYLVYLSLIKRSQEHKSMTFDDIAIDTDIQKSHISTYIKNLETKGVLQIDKKYNDKGIVYNKYTFYA